MLILLVLVSVNLSAQPLHLKVSHAPKQPRSDDSVKVNATAEGKVSEKLFLEVQVVEPGAYVRRTDPAYNKEWREFPMQETNGTFSASVPGDLQKHRRLIRYRIKAVSQTATNYFPALTNTVPNLAWFVYDGAPAWSGASQPGRTPSKTFSPEFFTTLPSYVLIARAEDVSHSQWDQAYYRRPLLGTFIFEGEVYDHIQFHNRGQASTYVAGKNKWGFKFNPGHDFAAKNFWGQPYKVKWSGLNLNPCASAWAQVNRGMAGMDEAVGYRAYQLAGVPSPDTFWVQFRVIATKEEAASQYAGDLWGLYLVVEEKNGAWLRENGYPDGNIYSAESGLKHVVPGSAPNEADLIRFRNGCNTAQTESWWEKHLDLPAYYSFHAINRLVANIDLRPDGNYYLYHRPDDHWVVLPHDLDMMLIPKTHQPGFTPQTCCLEIPALHLAFQNRAREILDLLASDPAADGGQIGQVVAELSQKITPHGQPHTWAELDEAIWNMHPRSHAKGQFYVTPYQDHRMGGHWERQLDSADFAGFCKYIVEFCTDSRRKKNYRPNDGDQHGYGFGFLAYEASDPRIPERPTIKLIGWKDQRPNFALSPFSSAGGAKFSSVEWRIGQVEAPGLKGYVPGKPCRYEIEPGWNTRIRESSTELLAPADAVAGDHTFRARARYQDETGRWSHWSEPVQFVAPLAAP